MSNNYFKIKESEQEFDLGIKKIQLNIWRTNDFEICKWYDKGLGLFISIESEKTILHNDIGKEAVTIFTEWLDVPLNSMKNKSFKALESIKIDFTGEDDINVFTGEQWVEAPGAIHIGWQRAFLQAKISFKYLENGCFNVLMIGSAEGEISFEVSVNCVLEVHLDAYDNKANKEDILNFFEKTLGLRGGFTYDWSFKDNDIFFVAKPKKSQNIC